MSTYFIGSMSVSDGHDILHYGRKGMHWGKRTFVDSENRQASMYINSNPAWANSLKRRRALKKRILAKATSNGPDTENVGLRKTVSSNPAPKQVSRSNGGYSGYSSTSISKKPEANKPVSQGSTRTTTVVKKEEKYAANNKTSNKTSKSSVVGKKLAGKISKK